MTKEHDHLAESIHERLVRANWSPLAVVSMIEDFAADAVVWARVGAVSRAAESRRAIAMLRETQVNGLDRATFRQRFIEREAE